MVRAAGPEIVAEFQRGYECWVRRDFDAMLEWYATDAEVDLSRVLPDESVVKGHDAILSYCDRMWDVWAGMRWEPSEIIEVAPDSFVVVQRVGTEGRASGVPVESELSLVYTLKDGMIISCVYYPSRETALAAAGAS